MHVRPGAAAAGTQLDQERLRLFEPDPERRRQVLHAVAEDLRWDEPDMASLLFALCGHHGKALEETNGLMSTRIRGLLDAATPAQERSLAVDVQALALRANDLRTRCAPFGHKTCASRICGSAFCCFGIRYLRQGHVPLLLLMLLFGTPARFSV